MRNKKIKNAMLVIASVFFSSCLSSKLTSDVEVFPNEEWQAVKSTAHVNLKKLNEIDSLMRAAHSNGILIMDGKVVKDWTYDGAADKKFEVQSITKAIVSMLLGIAIQEGKIAEINDKVITYYPGFKVGPFTDSITFKHLVTTSSGIKAKKWGSRYIDPNNMAPGIDARYHNDHFDELSRALTYIFEEPLIEVLRSRVLSKTGGTVEWRTDGEVILSNGRKVPVNAGYAFSKWNPADLARIGWLYLNKGFWKEEKIVDADYISDSMTPLNIPVMVSNGEGVIAPSTSGTYGYGFRATFLQDGNVLWYMSGNGGQMCVIMPELQMVFVKINGYEQSYRPYRGVDLFKDLLMALRLNDLP